MLKHVLSIYMVKRLAMSNIYIEEHELRDLLTNLNTSEVRMYNFLKFSPKYNLPPEEFKPDALAARLEMPVQTVRNTLSRLKKKGYVVIEFFKDNRKNLGVKVIVGKDQVELYSLGLDVEIKDAKTYRDLLNLFPLTNPTLAVEERKEMVSKANEYVRSLQK